MNKIQIISDKNKKSQKIKSALINKFKKLDVVKSNITIVIGGDGFMLQTLKKNKSLKKFFIHAIGIAHGLTNSGGTLLSIFILSLGPNKNINSSRYSITYFYFF